MKNRIWYLIIILLLQINPLKAEKTASVNGGTARKLSSDTYEVVTNTYDALVMARNSDNSTFNVLVYMDVNSRIILRRDAADGCDARQWFSNSYSSTWWNCWVQDKDNKTYSLKGDESDQTTGYYYYRCPVVSKRSPDTDPTTATEIAPIGSHAGMNTGSYNGIFNPGGLRAYTYYYVQIKRFMFNIEYVANGSTVKTENCIKYYSTNNFTLDSTTKPSCSKVGYTFKGWNTSNEKYEKTPAVVTTASFTNPTIINLDGTNATTHQVYAQWEAIKYTITYDSDGGSACSPLQYTILDSYSLASPTKAGYDFAGWKVKTSAGNWSTSESPFKSFSTGRYENVTLIAQWTPKHYNVKWSIDKNVGTTPATQSITYKTNCAASTFTITNKHFQIASVTKTVNLDGTIIYGPTTQTVTDPKSFTYPASQVEGETTITVTTQRVSQDVTITRNNLEGHDCTVITVTKSPEAVPTYTIVLSAQNPSVTLDRLGLGTYFITETTWANTYNKAAQQTITIQSSDTSDSRTVTLSGSKLSSSLYRAENYKTNPL